jgi:hypothetical protein
MQKLSQINHPAIKSRLSRKAGRKNLRHIYLRNLFQKQPRQDNRVLSAQEKQARRIVDFIKRHAPTSVICASILGCLTGTAFAVNVAELVAPISDLRESIFGGWMWVPKIGAAVGGCVLAVYNQSIMPFATGAGVCLGIHFYDLYLKADGALI